MVGILGAAGQRYPATLFGELDEADNDVFFALAWFGNFLAGFFALAWFGNFLAGGFLVEALFGAFSGDFSAAGFGAVECAAALFEAFFLVEGSLMPAWFGG